MSKIFQSNLKVQLEAKPSLSVKERRLLAALNDDTPGPLRRRQMRLAELHAREVVGFSKDGEVDWSKVTAIDWEILLPKLMDFLMMLFKLFA